MNFLFKAEHKRMNVGDISKRIALRDKLGCKNFRWYLENIFPESVMIVGSKAIGQVLMATSYQFSLFFFTFVIM